MMFLRLLVARVDGMLMLEIVRIVLPFLLERCRLVVVQLFI